MFFRQNYFTRLLWAFCILLATVVPVAHAENWNAPAVNRDAHAENGDARAES